MKKAVSIMLAIVMVLSIMSAVMAVSAATVFESTKIVNVTGRVENANKAVSVSLKEGKVIKCTNEFNVDKDGNYSGAFEFKGDITGKTIQVKQGNEDVTDSVVSAIAEDKVCSYTLDAANTEVLAEVENCYNSLTDCTVVRAYYDKNNKLENVIVNNKKAQDGLNQKDFEIPAGVEKIKVLIWNNTKTDIPLAEKPVKKGTINLLAIGNSHTANAFTYLPEIMEEGGYEFNGRNAMINGASFATHYNSIMNNIASYKINSKSYTLEQLLSDGTKYDYVVITNIIDFSDSDENFVKYSADIARFVRERQPTAEIIVHQTWAYEENSPDAKFNELYNGDRAAMNTTMKARNEYLCKYLAGISTSDGKPISLNGKPLRYIPSGDAFWNAGQDPLFQTRHTGGKYWADGHWWKPDNMDEVNGIYTTLYGDSYHAGRYHGCYLVGLTWYAALTGESVLDNTYTNATYPINEEARPVINKAAQDAVDATGVWTK